MTKGSNVETPQHDYQADDGLWYPSAELESYFKEARGTTYMNAASQIAALKELYSDEIADLVYAKNPFLKMIK